MYHAAQCTTAVFVSAKAGLRRRARCVYVLPAPVVVVFLKQCRVCAHIVGVVDSTAFVSWQTSAVTAITSSSTQCYGGKVIGLHGLEATVSMLCSLAHPGYLPWAHCCVLASLPHGPWAT
jgi:hypothetical protein